MPTIFSHAIFASALGSASDFEAGAVRFWLLTAGCAMAPDADALGLAFGISYGSMFGHRGFTHSIVFAITLGYVTASLFFRKNATSIWKWAIYFATATLSHPILDMLTNGGLGVALFAPFSGERYFFPWRPVEVSPIGFGFFSRRGFGVILSEILWIWLPSGLLAAVAFATGRLRSQRRTPESR